VEIILIGIAAVLGLYMAWNIGANDVANSMADAVGSRAITVRQAIFLAGVCEFAGAVLVGSHVTDTVRKGIVDPQAVASIPGLETRDAAVVFVIGMTFALLSAAFWLNCSSYLGMPVSTTHSIVGAVAGFGIIAAGWGAVNWIKMSQIVASWFISPVAGGVGGFLAFKFISRVILGREKPVKAAVRYAPFIIFIVTAIVTLAIICKGLKHVIGGLEWLSGDRALIVTGLLSLLAAVVSKFFSETPWPARNISRWTCS